MHEHELKSIGLNAAQRAVNAGGVLVKVAEPFYSGGYTYTHVLHTVRGAMYRVARTIADDIRMQPQRSALQCAARACPGCTVCRKPPNDASNRTPRSADSQSDDGCRRSG